MEMMNAIEISRPGGPEVLIPARRPVPTPGAGEVLIRVKAAGVNRPDVFQRLGNYAPPPGVSDIPGLEIAGTIVEGDTSGDNPFGLSSGSEVCALLAGGGYAEYASVPLAQCLPLPRGLSAVEGASLPETYFTVMSNLFDRGRLGAGEGGPEESLLVHGGSSGIGVAAIQIARAFGHPVFATAGSEEKCRACESLGTRAINYREEDFVERVRSMTGGRGVDVVLDMVAGNYVGRELSILAEGGRIVIIATLGGTAASVDAGLLMRRRITITGSTLRPRPVAFKAAIARSLYERVWPLLEAGSVRPVIHRVLPAHDAAAAHALLEEGSHIGKIVLEW